MSEDNGGFDDLSDGTSYYAACDSGPHTAWTGPTRMTRDEAQQDADRHNTTCSAQGAAVIS